jgi:hypothetical protein
MMNQEKMMKTAKALDTLFRIARKIALIALIVLAIAVVTVTIVHFVNPEATIGTDFSSLDVGPVTFSVTPEAAPSNRQVLVLTWIIFLFAAGCGLILYDILGRAGKILDPMKEGNPFHPTVANNIRRIGILILILDLVQQVTDFALSLYANHFIREMLPADASVFIESNFQLSLTGVLVFFILLLVSYVFQYGAQLQQLSDETL